MRRSGRFFGLAVVMVLFSTACFAETHSNVQAVDTTGYGTHPDLLTMNKITVEGIILNRPEYMVDISGSAAEWQIYVQGEGGDHAGTAIYMRKDNWGGGTYTDQEWADELDRISNDPNGNYGFRPGDRVRVTGLLKFYYGKTNINERHTTNPDYDFTIDLIDPDAGLPEPEVITLGQVKDTDDNFIFDYTRATGCEYYQGVLVRVNDVNISDGIWGIDNTMTIKDSTGRTFPLKLGIGPGFSQYSAPTGQIDVIGIFDQESADYKAGYRIWVVNYDGNSSVLTDNCGLNGYFAGDMNKDCVVDFADFAIMAQDWLKCSNPSFYECIIP
ncbi:MAG: hypothetical protein KJ757_08340 [Planctomycetes bacterium]|nr:hypothetical protein [Planctomycetota bacterium]MBU1517542.1 hypothetical protein [Planctomycetota bacterium]MBU2457577.1 hypothetical protein [Planctomycetota bacterium]MBU2597551.1 hypothetical protein [Planctomycetota bacterium]